MARILRQFFLRRALLKYLVLFVPSMLVASIIYIEYKPLSSGNKAVTLALSNSANESNISQLNASSTTQQRKVFMAFGFSEQLTMATNNLLQLLGFAAYGGRQVVVPFVSDSFFHGTVRKNQTLELYYNMTALNDTLLSHGHGTFISWKEFQNVCKGRLDVLVHLDYSRLSQKSVYSRDRPFIPCREGEKMIQGIEVGNTICVNVFALDSGERFEKEAVKKLPCVGFKVWVGSDRRYPYRAQFDLKPVVGEVLSHAEVGDFFNPKLFDIARDFISKNLPPRYISVHLRVESILWNGGNLPLAKTCISNLTAHVQKLTDANDGIPVFLSTDFSEFGSSSPPIARIKRDITPSLMEILSPLKAVTFKPSDYKLTDKGTVAIVEMSIMASGKHLVVLGGGSFQAWTVTQFVKKNGNDRSKVEDIRWK